MSAVIASQSSPAYFAQMPSLVLRLLSLVALVLMPFGMGTASAVPVHHAPASAAQHCDEYGGQPAERSSDQAIDCAMACSMLATAEAHTGEAAPIHRLPIVRPLTERWTGLHPDTATPPPKRS